MPIIPALWKLRHEDQSKLKDVLGLHTEYQVTVNYAASFKQSVKYIGVTKTKHFISDGNVDFDRKISLL